MAYVGEKSELEIVQDEAVCPMPRFDSVAKKNSLVLVLASTAVSIAVIICCNHQLLFKSSMS